MSDKTAAGTVVTVAEVVGKGLMDSTSDFGAYCPGVMLVLLLLWLL